MLAGGLSDKAVDIRSRARASNCVPHAPKNMPARDVIFVKTLADQRVDTAIDWLNDRAMRSWDVHQWAARVTMGHRASGRAVVCSTEI